MKDFAAINFETANQQRTSVCSVGIVIVRDGEIADSYYSLIKSEPNRCRSLCLDSKRAVIVSTRTA